MLIKKVAFLAILLCFYGSVNIVCAQSPGTVSDPLVSKSYLDHFFRFRSVVVPVNSDIKPEPGAMIIVRSGQLKLEGDKGKSIVDLTVGNEIPVGSDLPLNHLLIIPDSAEYILKAKKLTLLLAACLEEKKPAVDEQ